MTPVLISFVICFSVGLLLSVVLIYHDVKPRRPNRMNESLEHTYLWERVLDALFGACQAALSIAGITAIVFALRSKGEMYWVGMAVRCNLQLLTGTNLARILRVLMFPRWAIWLAYMIAILTAPNIVYPMRGSNNCFAYGSEPLYLLAAASLLSSAVSRGRLENHENSGSDQDGSGYKQLLTVFIITNAIAASFQLCGAIVIYSISLAESKIDTSLRQGIYLVCPDHYCCAI
ncbi:hypothetical protein GQ44DRAFT_137323 [Phaeosphaeriaceae sp. PMI808]|nr:hypothetical protein GQ44DRAFT_137323 [Phaeosphaeriaceae sp. PMI808]